MRKLALAIIGFQSLLIIWFPPGIAQEIRRDNYLRFVPLTYPRIVGQTAANAAFHLYGNPDDPNYQDVNPVDGIDDARRRCLLELAVKFAPHLVRNTTAIPMDFKKFMEGRKAFPLYIDTWEISRVGGELIKTETIDFVALLRSPCHAAPSASSNDDDTTPAHPLPTNTASDDCRLLALLQEFHPTKPQNERFKNPVIEPNRNLFKVMYFDFPGADEQSWKSEYENFLSGELPRAYHGFAKIYAHPFIHEVHSNLHGMRGYEFILQYWFFYPFNDGGNNHEGDWEHLNVAVTIKGNGHGLLSAEEIRQILTNDGTAPDEQLVISRVEYYFHHKVMILDFLNPNVYLPPKEWQAEIKQRGQERLGEKWLWEKIRELAYVDRKESRINTHPLGYIGADNKGTDQLLALPGGKNRDSHGTYPFPGLYKDVGPAAAAELINARFNYHFKIDEISQQANPRVERYDDPAKIEIVPDWERVVDLVQTDPQARREWSWLVLPLRWGFPATASPFAGAVPHAETGNLAPFGPAYNSGWNRVGAAAGYALYDPHKFGSNFPLGWQDGFVNSWGFLNLFLPTLAVMPPFDFAWRVAFAPPRWALQLQRPTFFPKETIPFRHFGLATGASFSFLSNDFALLFTAPAQFDELRRFIAATDTLSTTANEHAENDAATIGKFNFYLGKRMVSENMVRHLTSITGFDIQQLALGRAVPVRADLEMWEYAGSLRYNLFPGRLQPFVKAGYGLSWYRLKNARLGDQPLDNPDTEWVRRPSLLPPRNLLPNTWHLGFGVELIPFRSYAAFPKGVDLGLRADYAIYFHSLGLSRQEILSDQEETSLRRSHVGLELVMSF